MLKNIGSNWVVTALQIAVLMCITPYAIHALGKDDYGIWESIVALTGFLSLLVLGIPMASVRFIAEQAAKKDVEGTNRAIATCNGICIGLGALALVVGGVLYFVFDAFYLHGDSWDLGPDEINDARLAFGVVVVQVAAAFAMRLPYGVLEAHHDFVSRGAIMSLELVLRLGLTFALLAWNASLWVLASVQVLCMLTEFTACRVVIAKRYGHLRFSLARFDRTILRGILSFSLFAMLLNVGALLAFRIDALVIGKFLPPDEVTYYGAGNKFFEPLTQLVIGIGAVVMPMATALKTRGDADQLPGLLLKWSKVSLSLALVVGLYLVTLGPEFLACWLGPEFEERSGQVLQVLMLSFFLFLPVRGVALPMLMGVGRPERPAFALLAMGLLNLAISVALVRPLGILGVALGTAVPNVLFALTLLVLACRELSIGVGRYLSYVAFKATLGALPVAALGLVLKYVVEVEGLIPLLASGVGMVLVFGLTWILFVYKDDPYFDLRAELARRLGRGGPAASS